MAAWSLVADDMVRIAIPKSFSNHRAATETEPPGIVIKPTKGWGSLGLGELWQYRELLWFLTLRDIRGKYRHMALGPIWIIIKPVASMVIFSLVFGSLAKLPSEGIPYPIFTYTALLPWIYFQSSVLESVNSMRARMGIISKIYFPRLVVPCSAVLSGLVDLAISSVVLLGMMAYFGFVPTVAALALPLYLLMAMAAALALGLWTSAMEVKFRDFSLALSYGLQGWMYLTPVAYTASSPIFRFKPVAFVDDDPQKVGGAIMGVPIAAPCADLGRVIADYQVDMAIIAAPSATPAEKRTLVELCQQAGVSTKIIPTAPELLDTPVSLSRVREVDAADLLSRPPARLDREAVQRFAGGKTILVTGAAGSVGSELARQLAGLQPELLVLIDHAENPLMFLEMELRENFLGTRLVAQIADISHDVEMHRIMARHRPQVLFHAAAHKHVNLMERAPGAAVLNNVGGTYILARNAMDTGIETFVLVSTDKAVKPTSVMGASKRLAEMLLQELDGEGRTQFISVRFGNVLGSNGSVVPIFKQQIAKGGPVTVTHPEADRYFMSISEAAGLILQAGAVGKGGETFVLDMGEPVRIVDLAETLIALVGLRPHEDVDIVYTGLRPGEKLSEELLADDENFLSTGYEKLLMLRTTSSSGFLAAAVGEFLHVLPELDTEQVRSRLRSLVPEYQPSKLVDTYVPG